MRVAAIFLMAVLGCSPDWPDGANHFQLRFVGDTASGARSGTCQTSGPRIDYSKSEDFTIFVVNCEATEGDRATDVSILVTMKGRPEPLVANQSSTNYRDASFSVSNNGNAWSCRAGELASSAGPTGTFTLGISALAIQQEDALGAGYLVHGTLHAVCPGSLMNSANPGVSSPGTITLDGTY
jgi:hypothetical protein